MSICVYTGICIYVYIYINLNVSTTISNITKICLKLGTVLKIVDFYLSNIKAHMHNYISNENISNYLSFTNKTNFKCIVFQM